MGLRIATLGSGFPDNDVALFQHDLRTRCADSYQHHTSPIRTARCTHPRRIADTLCTMLSVASAICGHDLFEVIITNIATVGWLATEENEWSTLFHRYLPDWLALTDKNALTVYFTGESNLYLRPHLLLWWKPVLAWTGFIVVLLFTTFCINVILRKQWIEVERLSYPIIELPYQMTTAQFFRSKPLWVGIVLAGGIDVINGLAFSVSQFSRTRR